MTRSLFAFALLGALSAGTVMALDPPICNQTNTTGQKAGQRKGKKTGPQDGTGPIHEPGTGGGTGAGRRAGRK